MRVRYVVGLDPDMAALEREPGTAVLERSGGDMTAALIRVPADRASAVKELFHGVSHVYETEEEARRVWSLFGA